MVMTTPVQLYRGFLGPPDSLIHRMILTISQTDNIVPKIVTIGI
jgi:hypothetical protein